MNTNERDKIIWASVITAIAVVAVLGILTILFRADIATYLTAHIQQKQESTQSQTSVQTVHEEKVVSVVADALPSVVSIVITKDVPVYETYFEEQELFPGLLFPQPRQRQEGTEEREIGGGSGFLVSSDGLIVTNRHVVSVEDASYTVFTNDGEKHQAEIVAKDPVLDIAILRIPGAGHQALSFGDSEKLQAGQTTIAIGNALTEFENSVSVGVISGLSRSIVAGDRSGRSEVLDRVIQTDAAINPGNSGGPLLNTAGEVIGVNVAIAQGTENIGFAIPSSVVRNVVDSVIEHGEIVRPFLGVQYRLVTERLAERNNLPVSRGALILRGENPDDLAVIPGSPADKAGLVENDIILSVEGEDISPENPLATVLRRYNVGETITMTVLHRGEEIEVSVTLEAFDE